MTCLPAAALTAACAVLMLLPSSPQLFYVTQTGCALSHHCHHSHHFQLLAGSAQQLLLLLHLRQVHSDPIQPPASLQQWLLLLLLAGCRAVWSSQQLQQWKRQRMTSLMLKQWTLQLQSQRQQQMLLRQMVVCYNLAGSGS